MPVRAKPRTEIAAFDVCCQPNAHSWQWILTSCFHGNGVSATGVRDDEWPCFYAIAKPFLLFHGGELYGGFGEGLGRSLGILGLRGIM